jgi:hypothetical protein
VDGVLAEAVGEGHVQFFRMAVIEHDGAAAGPGGPGGQRQEPAQQALAVQRFLDPAQGAVNGGGLQFQQVEIGPGRGTLAGEDPRREAGLALGIDGEARVGEVGAGHHLREGRGADRLQSEIRRLVHDKGDLVVQRGVDQVGGGTGIQFRQIDDDPQPHDLGQAGAHRKALGVDDRHDAGIPPGGQVRQQGELIFTRTHEDHWPFDDFRHDTPADSVRTGRLPPAGNQYTAYGIGGPGKGLNNT